MPRYPTMPTPPGYTIRENSQRQFQGEAPNGDLSPWYARRQIALEWCRKHEHGWLASQRATSMPREESH